MAKQQEKKIWQKKTWLCGFKTKKKQWLTRCGKGCGCGLVNIMHRTMFLYTKRCVKSRCVSWYMFENKQAVTFPVERVFLSYNYPCPRNKAKTSNLLVLSYKVFGGGMNCFLVPSHTIFLRHYLDVQKDQVNRLT